MSKLALLAFALPALASASESGSGSDDEYQQGAACYGFGGGHGVWKCGTSAAWCTEIGGVARYTEGYTSSRSGMCMCKTGCPEGKVMPGFTKDDTHDGKACKVDGDTHCGVSSEDCETKSGTFYAVGAIGSDGCCLCNENCDHDKETGTDCTYGTAVASPAPPPQPPSPPPSPMFPPVLGDAGFYETVTVKLNVTGNVEDYTDAKASLIAAKFSVACGVHSDDIAVSFAAGSVIITIAINVPDAAAVAKVEAALEPHMADAAAMNTFLGGSYGSILYRQSVQEVMPLEKGSTGLPTGALIGIIIAAVVVVLIIGFIAMKMMKKPVAAASKTPV
jgi:hypothetical protein